MPAVGVVVSAENAENKAAHTVSYISCASKQAHGGASTAPVCVPRTKHTKRGNGYMAEDNYTLTTFYTSWKAYQDRLKAALAPLTAEQLTLRAAPGLRSIGENAAHIIGCRVGWFTVTLGEDASADVTAVRWDEPGGPARSAAELVRGLDLTWQLMADCLTRWRPADMQQTFPDD